jgi:arylsulfatase A-like enzyme
MLHGVRSNGIALDRRSVTFVDLLRAAGWRTALVGKSHLQNATGRPAAERRHPRPEHVAPPPEMREAVRDDRTAAHYLTEINPGWRENPNRTIPLPYYGYEFVRLTSSHADRVEGDYTSWLKARHPDPDTLRGRENALPSPEYSVPQAWRTRIPEELYPTRYIAEEAAKYLEHHQASADGRPFFLTCSFPDPHHPFTPPGKYWDMYDPADIPIPASWANRMTDDDMPPELWRAYRNGIERPEAEWPVPVTQRQAQEAIALTYGMISMIDDAVGQVLASLSEETRANTVVLFTSDHGDYMGDHGVILKLGLHFQGIIRIPFIWHDPFKPARDVREDIGGTIDIAATILGRAGLQTSFGMQGRDLFSDITDITERDIVIDDYGMVVLEDPDAKAGLMSLVTSRWRLTVFEGSNWGQLYDLEEDPLELNDLWNEPSAAGIRTDLIHRLLRRVVALRDRRLSPTALA